MKEDIKKKFLDILFETEETEEAETIVDEPMKDVKLTDKPAVLKAHDILYKKDNSINTIVKQKPEAPVQVSLSNSFISLNTEPKKEEVKKEEIKEKYEIKPNISPMFGVVKNGEPVATPIEPKEVFKEEKPFNMSAPLKKSHDSYLGTIISPIFGYDVKNDLSNTMNLSIHKVESAYEQDQIQKPDEEEKKTYYVKENDKLDDQVNALSTDDLDQYAPIEEDVINSQEFEVVDNNPVEDEDYSEPEVEDYASDPIFQEVLKEERGFSNTEEIDLFEDLFKED